MNKYTKHEELARRIHALLTRVGGEDTRRAADARRRLAQCAEPAVGLADRRQIVATLEREWL